MASDLYIHVFEGEVTEDDLAFVSRSTIGSKHFNPHHPDPPNWSEMYHRAFEKIDKVPWIWIGEVSWLKAALCEKDPEEFIPGTVAVVSEAIGEDLPVLDDALLAKIMDAFRIENTTCYALADSQAVREFLESHKGKRLFTVS